MMPRTLLRPDQIAWLAEIGVDTHWLASRPGAGAPKSGAAALPAETVPAEAALPNLLPAGQPAALVSPMPVPGLARVRAPAGLVTPPLMEPGAGIAPGDCQDLSALDAAVAACRRCERHVQRIQAVPGMGLSIRPHYLIIGEQPGIEDDGSGRPFQGDQGRLLAAMLAAARLPQGESAYLTYVVKCRAVGGREPPAQDIAACLPWLHRQISLLQPQWILALGRVAAQAVIGTDTDLDGLRGGPHRYIPEQGEPIPVWVTHQPSSLLVRSAWKAQAWRDLAGLAAAVREADEKAH